VKKLLFLLLLSVCSINTVINTQPDTPKHKTINLSYKIQKILSNIYSNTIQASVKTAIYLPAITGIAYAYVNLAHNKNNTNLSELDITKAITALVGGMFVTHGLRKIVNDIKGDESYYSLWWHLMYFY